MRNPDGTIKSNKKQPINPYPFSMRTTRGTERILEAWRSSLKKK